MSDACKLICGPVARSDSCCTSVRECLVKTPEGEEFICECICKCSCKECNCKNCQCKCECKCDKNNATRIVTEDGTVKYRCECVC